MKVLVSYLSKTGNTKAVAEAIYGAIEERIYKDIIPVNEVGDTESYDLIFFGFPIHAHSVPVPAHDFMSKIPSGKSLALFSTHGALRESKMAKEALEHAISLAKGVKIVGTFNCRGKVPEKIIESLITKPEHKAWAETAMTASSHPDKADLEDAKTFALAILKKVGKFDAFPIR